MVYQVLEITLDYFKSNTFIQIKVENIFKDIITTPSLTICISKQILFKENHFNSSKYNLIKGLYQNFLLLRDENKKRIIERDFDYIFDCKLYFGSNHQKEVNCNNFSITQFSITRNYLCKTIEINKLISKVNPQIANNYLFKISSKFGFSIEDGP